MKTIGVVIATYNGQIFLKEQIDSIVGQTRRPLKIIVVDDVSKDGTHGIIRRYMEQYPETFIFIQNERNLGAKGAFEIGISACDTDYIVLSDQDDIWEQNKLEVLYDVMEKNKEALLCFHDMKLIDHEGKPMGRNFWEAAPLHEPLPVTGAEARRRLAGLSNPVPGCTMFFSSDLKKHILPIPASKWVGHDWWISVAAYFLADPVFVKYPLTRYRLHSDQTAGVGTNLKKADFEKKKHSLPFKIKREVERIFKRGDSRKNRLLQKDVRVIEMSSALMKMIETCERLNSHPVDKSELQHLRKQIEERLASLHKPS